LVPKGRIMSIKCRLNQHISFSKKQFRIFLMKEEDSFGGI